MFLGLISWAWAWGCLAVPSASLPQPQGPPAPPCPSALPVRRLHPQFQVFSIQDQARLAAMKSIFCKTKTLRGGSSEES